MLYENETVYVPRYSINIVVAKNYGRKMTSGGRNTKDRGIKKLSLFRVCCSWLIPDIE
jgi:hypothetical protein